LKEAITFSGRAFSLHLERILKFRVDLDYKILLNFFSIFDINVNPQGSGNPEGPNEK